MPSPSDVLIVESGTAKPLWIVTTGAPLEGRTAVWAKANDFTGRAGQLLLVPGKDGGMEAALFGVGDRFDPMSLRGVAARLPAGDWRLEGPEVDDLGALAFVMGQYRFDRYKPKADRGAVRLVVGGTVDVAATMRIAGACDLARRMVDTPAADMGPAGIEAAAREIAEGHGASIAVVVGDGLLEGNYPAIHAVGRAATAERAPRIIEIGWNLDRTDLPLVALVGKGVVFDTGGLNIKGGAGMRNMKKDMGGAAHALALAQMVMGSGLAVRLVVLVGAVENAISADAFRPGDVLDSRKGLTIEIGNTDAEGRLVLADCLARASEHAPDLTLDFATLTGAARIALGPELPPLYTDDEALAGDLLMAAQGVRDPLWRMPLWPGYRSAVESEIADVRNDSAAWAQAGSVTAALFLQRFAPTTGAWAHMDIFAWNPRGRPGWPEGAEAQAIRACHAMMAGRYPAK